MNKKEFREKLTDYLDQELHTSIEKANAEQMYKALAGMTNDALRDRYREFKNA